MPLDTATVGQQTQAFEHAVDARWLMAYAAGLDDLNPRYMDTQANTVAAHPVFPVCLEWPVILSSRHLQGSESVTAREGAKGVHAAHDLHLYRPITAGDVLTTQATVIGLKAIKPGAAQTTRLDTTNARGELVCRTYQLGISRGVAVIGEPLESEAPPELPALAETSSAVEKTEAIQVPAQAAHVYTECARIWNPIHTDRAVAIAAGLPDIILHGTATLAMAVSRLVDGFTQGDSTRVRRLGGRFAAMVLMPSTLTLEVVSSTPGVVHYRVLTESGDPAISNGFFCYE